MASAMNWYRVGEGEQPRLFEELRYSTATWKAEHRVPRPSTLVQN
jgi:hypothetical protein|tara:strand:+ start:312 stop:446 length:135 start_codon:yes stop_codon:yes gene_type:complete